MSFRSSIKTAVIILIPRLYHMRLIRQGIKEMNVNRRDIQNKIVVPYDPAGRYPTMYNTPPTFYKKRKKNMYCDYNGVPMYKINGKLEFHPVYMIQSGLSDFGFYCSTSEKSYFNDAKIVADWLVKNQNPDSGLWVYNYDYYHEMTGCLLKAPWSSAMAQGQAMSLLSRMYRVTNDKKYLDASLNAYKMLIVPISDGGLASDLWGHTVFEEYPTEPNSYTLNGFMFTALGLYDLSTVTDDEDVQKLWGIAKKTLQFMIPLYDGDVMSVYCLSHVSTGVRCRHWADAYHPIHIIMLQCFESIIPNPAFEFYIKRWSSFLGIHIEE